MSTPERTSKQVRDASLATCKMCAGLLIVLGLASAAGGIAAGLATRTTAGDILGNEHMTDAGWAYAASGVGGGLVLVLAGAIVVGFANALRADG